MDEHVSPSSATILLGRSFIKTAKTKINIDKGTILVEFDEDVKCNIYDAMKFQ